MTEYIERKAAKCAIRDLPAKLDALAVQRSIEAIDRVSAADVEPVRHGKWIIRGGRFRCSVCDKKALWTCEYGTGGLSREYTQAKSDRCPNCGAKMDEEANHDDRLTT